MVVPYERRLCENTHQILKCMRLCKIWNQSADYQSRILRREDIFSSVLGHFCTQNVFTQPRSDRNLAPQSGTSQASIWGESLS